jgi:hypothetical protein
VLNPFDPEQIDVKAIVDYTDENYHSQPVFGFFYRDYQRITVYNNPYSEDMDDPDNWRWDEVTTEYRFRRKDESCATLRIVSQTLFRNDLITQYWLTKPNYMIQPNIK